MQVAYLQILVIILDGDCSSDWRSRYVQHVGTLQGLSEKFPELNRLVARIEQVDSHAQLLRVARDLFSLSEEKRKFATLALKQKFKVTSLSSDLYKDAGKNADWILKLGKLNQMQVNEFDVRNFLSLITQTDNLDYTIKKSALEQLTHYLSDSSMYFHTTRRSTKALIFEGRKSLFSHCLNEVLEVGRELKGENVDLALHPSQLAYVSQCAKFLSASFVYYRNVIS